MLSELGATQWEGGPIASCKGWHKASMCLLYLPKRWDLQKLWSIHQWYRDQNLCERHFKFSEEPILLSLEFCCPESVDQVCGPPSCDLASCLVSRHQREDPSIAILEVMRDIIMTKAKARSQVRETQWHLHCTGRCSPGEQFWTREGQDVVEDPILSLSPAMCLDTSLGLWFLTLFPK